MNQRNYEYGSGIIEKLEKGKGSKDMGTQLISGADPERDVYKRQLLQLSLYNNILYFILKNALSSIQPYPML